MPIEVLLTFFTASVLLALAPGPDNIFVLIHSAVHGRIAGIFVTLGLCTGLIVHTTAAALGVAALFKLSALAFTTLKVAGSVYLLFLCWQAFRASAKKINFKSANKLKRIHLYRRGIVMNVTNPKVSLFFVAFLPQFINSTYGSVLPQFFILGGLFIIATMLVFGSVAFLASSLGERINKSSSTQRTINRLAGAVFAGIALKLITAKQ